MKPFKEPRLRKGSAGLGHQGPDRDRLFSDNRPSRSSPAKYAGEYCLSWTARGLGLFGYPDIRVLAAWGGARWSQIPGLFRQFQNSQYLRSLRMDRTNVPWGLFAPVFED